MKHVCLKHPNQESSYFIFRSDGTYDFKIEEELVHKDFYWSLSELDDKIILMYRQHLKDSWSYFWLTGLDDRTPSSECFVFGQKLLSWTTCIELLGDEYVVED